jgi:hypothetical protein
MEPQDPAFAKMLAEMELPVLPLGTARLLEMLAYAENAERSFLASGNIQEAEIMRQVASILRRGLAH